MKRTCLIVSPCFPPSTLAGVHRARHLAKHLPPNGWTPIVVTVDEAYYEERLDWDLAALVPSSTEIIKVKAIPQRYCRPLGLGEISLRAWFPLRGTIDRLLSTRDIDAVLITGSPYYPMLMTTGIKQRFGVPVVHDFQDPWVSAGGANQPRWSKGWLSNKLSIAFEPKAVRAADFITSVSEQQNNELFARYPWLDRRKMAAIPIGGDPGDYDALQLKDFGGSIDSSTLDGHFHIVYAGTIWPPVIPTLRTLLKAARRVREQAPNLYAQLRLDFIGTTANPNETTEFRVLPLAQAEGVAEIVTEIPRRIPYLEALGIQAKANAILVLGSNEPHYTASKIFGILMSGKPYLSIFHEQSSAHEILNGAGAGISMSFKSHTDLVEKVEVISDAIIRLMSNSHLFGVADPVSYASYTANAIAEQFVTVFDRIARR